MRVRSRSTLFLGLVLLCLLTLVAGQLWASTRAEEMSGYVTNNDLIVLRSHIFDPALRVPVEADFALSPWRDTLKGSVLHIVQFHQTPTATDRRLLARYDAEFIYYIPNNAYLVRLNDRDIREVRQLSAVRSIFRLPKWSKIAPEIYQISDDLFSLELIAVPGMTAQGIYGFIGKRYPEVTIMTWHYHHVRGRVICEVPLTALDLFLDEVSGLEDVLSIMHYIPKQLLNDDSIWVGQSYDTANTTNYSITATIWNHNILGTDQIVCVNDSGLDSDMCYFRYDGNLSSKTTAQFPIPPDIGTVDYSKKVIAYYVEPGAEEYDTASASYHGTHVSGSVLGDNYANLSTPTSHGHDNGDGMAPNAQLVMQDVGDSGGALAGLAGDLTDTFQQAYDAGARIHSDSWGTTASNYDATALDMDEFMFRHEDFLFVVAMGNSGTSPADGSIGAPATAKNIVSVGATTNGGASSQADNLMSYSRGPVDDGRRKPDVVSPGSSINSASGTTSNTDDNCSPKSMSGTSMATPTTSGYLALLRQYFTDGFYPTGAVTPADAIIPSGALMKACLVNGATPLGGTDNLTSSAVSTIPSMDQGWGRTHLDNVLFFNGDARRLRFWDVWNMNGMQTGQQKEYYIDVTSSAQPLEVHLVWTDPESTTLAATNLVNNLDLEVVDPAGTSTYLGNVFSGGVSTTGGSADVLNPVEGVRINSPATGTWTLRVTATSVPGIGSAPYSDTQGYALVATFADCSSSLSPPTGLTATDNGLTGIDLTWNSVSGATAYLVYRAVGSSPGDEEFSLVDTTTLTYYTDIYVQGGFTYTYKVRATDDCSESAASTPDTATYTGNCSLYPDFDGLVSVTNDISILICDLILDWDAATSNCPLGPDITYNIYSDSDPYFVPDVGNLIVSGLTGTTFTDYSVNSHVTYYYIVRAEDSTTLNSGPNNGGNEDTNVNKLSGTTWSSATVAGTWSDDGGDTNAKLILEGEWQVTNQLNHTASGSLSYHNALDGSNHSAGLCIAATTPELDLQSGSPSLSYWVNYNLEVDFDGVVTEITTNGGADWTTLTPGGGYPGDFSQTGSPPINACNYTSTQACFNGPAGNGGLSGWTQYTHDLTSYAEQTVQVRWNFASDPGLEFEGLYLDDIEITLASVNLECAASDGQVRLDLELYTCDGDTININVGDVDIQGNGTQNVSIDSSVSEPGGETVLLIETPPNTGNFIGSILTTSTPPPSVGLLSVTDGETITVTYIDLDDGLGGFNVDKTDTAQTDCVAPVISNVGAINVMSSSATIIWDTDELSDSMVYYGTTPPTWATTSDGTMVTGHSVDLSGLTECTTYFYWVESNDAAANTAWDDASGSYYTFETGVNVQPTYSVSPGSPITDYNNTYSTINVSDNKTILDVDVMINITHTYDGDLEIYLIAPDLTEIDLSSDNGIGGDNYIDTVFDDEASTLITAGTAPFTGSFIPEQPLSTFDSMSALGDWQLRVYDDAGSDTGTLNSWSITFTYPAQSCGPHACYDAHALVQDTCVTGGAGDNDGIWDAGDQVQFSVTVYSDGTSLLTGVSATLTPLTTGVFMVDGTATYADIPTYTTQVSQAPHFTAYLSTSLNCGDFIDFQIDITSNEGNWSDTFSQQLGLIIPGSGNALDEDFETSGIPGTWTIIDGLGDDWTWFTDNSGDPENCLNTDPNLPIAGNWAAVDSDCNSVDMDEELITPILDLSMATTVSLEFDHYFNSFGSEVADVDIRSTNTGGVWTNVDSWTADTTNPIHESFDITSDAAGANDVEIRWHYYNANYEFYWYVDNVIVDYTAPSGCDMNTCVGGCAPATASIDSVTPAPVACQGFQQTFDGSGNGEGALTYEWDFDYDGLTFDVMDSGTTVNYTYGAIGSFTAALRVTDSCASPGPQEAIDTILITINDNPAVSPGNDGPTTLGNATNFLANRLGGNGPFNFSWDFGDAIGTSTDENPNYTYGAVNSYTACVTVTDSNGCTSGSQCTIVDIVPAGTVDEVPTNTIIGKSGNDVVFSFGAASGASHYNVYRGSLDNLATTGVYEHDTRITEEGCSGSPDTTVTDVNVLGDGNNYYYLINGNNGSCEGTFGNDGQGVSRENGGFWPSQACFSLCP